MQKGGHPIEALDSYKRALDCLKRQEDEELFHNLEINMAEMYLRAKRFDDAGRMLKGVLPFIRSDEIRDTALAMRFWRRMRDLNIALRRWRDSIDNQQEVLRISRILFQENSITSLQEEHVLMSMLLENGRFGEGYKIALRFKDLLGRNPSASTKYRCLSWIGEFSVSSAKLASGQLLEGNFMEALRMLRVRRRFADDLSSIALWNRTYELACKMKSPQAIKIFDEIIEILEKNFPKVEACSAYASLSASLVVPKIYNNNIDATVEEEMAKIVFARERCVAPDQRNRDTAWIQYTCLYAVVLIHLKKYSEAEKVIDRVEPSPDSFNDDSIFNGIHQARIQGLAKHYAEIGDRAQVKKQFNKIRSELAKMYRFKKARVEKLLDAWDYTERELMEKIDS